MNRNFHFICAVSLAVLASCASPSQRAWTPKQWGDELEKTPLHSSFESVTNRFGSQSDWKLFPVTRFGVGHYAGLDPNSPGCSNLTFYRQFPPGILLYVKPEDYRVFVDWDDGPKPVAAFIVFFSADRKFKGYYGYADHSRFSIDSRERLAEEKESYRELKIHDALKSYIDEVEKSHGQRPLEDAEPSSQ
jgi:hypothetical protein